MELGAIRDIGSDGQRDQITQQQMDDGAERIKTPVAEFVCPSRRGAETYLFNHGTPLTNVSMDNRSGQLCARNDYAANGGDLPPTAAGQSLERWEADCFSQDSLDVWLGCLNSKVQAAFRGPIGGVGAHPALNPNELRPGTHTARPAVRGGAQIPGTQGAVGAGIEIKLSQIADGTSKTIWVGEKYIHVDNYDKGAGAPIRNWGNDQGWDVGLRPRQRPLDGLPTAGRHVAA